jgi:hypothetical protein
MSGEIHSRHCWRLMLAVSLAHSMSGVAPAGHSRTAMMRLGGALLGRLLAADPGHRGPQIDCGAGHAAEFVGYRTRTIQTVLGSVALRRAYYHCAACGRGVVPRDDELGVTGVSLSRGLRRMVARAGAAPFAQAADLLAELAGIRLTPSGSNAARKTTAPRRPSASAPSWAPSRAGKSPCWPRPPTAAQRRTSPTSPSTAPACRWCPPPRVAATGGCDAQRGPVPYDRRMAER